MGGGTSKNTAKSATHQARGRRNSVQDEAHSVRSKNDALKMLLKNESSKLAFQNYLRPKDSAAVNVIDYYIKVDELKKENSLTAFRSKVVALINVYGSLSLGSVESKKISCDDLSNLLDTSKTDEQLSKSRNDILMLLHKTQDECLLKLNPSFIEYLESDAYKEWNRKEVKDKAGKKNADMGPRKKSVASQKYPNVLVIDDNLISLRMIGLSTEFKFFMKQSASFFFNFF